MEDEKPIRTWLRDLPKAELHLHLEGTVTPETLVILSARHDATPLTLAQARALYEYSDFLHFLACFKLVCDRLQTPEDYALIALDMMRSLVAQGVVHAEVYIAWGGIIHRKPHLQVADVMAAVEEARVQFVRDHREFSVLWIADATRQFGADHVARVFRLAAQLRDRFPAIIGVGIGGDEVAGPVESFRESYAEAKAAGLRLTAHAGEGTNEIQGPLEIRAALEMDVERIGHGVMAQHDADLIRLLARARIPIEINVTSNLLTRACPLLSEHPLPRYLESGVLCTLNSDDPAMFASSCLDEYVLVHESFGVGAEGMRDLARNSVLASFLGAERKQELLLLIDRFPQLV